jgi:NADH:ubiquinone oxidoreductase subunit 5 (subunit L)/multisubunit Na+/H+ antiporter MnhA subunit
MGAPVMLLGGLTAVLGIMHALMERDVKRLLAYSTIENIGVIFATLGLAMAFSANGMRLAAALAFTAALFHALNHSLFKSLLFFVAGSIVTATGERDIEKLGGLTHRMKVTAPVFLIGCVAISALPPLNGFASEWLSFQAVLQSPALPQLGLKILAPTVGALLALAAALAGACFVRLYGVAFLGRPRSEAAAQARETDAWSLTATTTLAALCVAAGVFPGAIIDALSPVTVATIGERMPAQMIGWWSVVPVAESRSSYNALLLFAFIAFSALLAAASRIIAVRAHRRAAAWGCGYEQTGPQSQYTATSFAQPVRNTLGRVIFRARESVDMPAPGDNRPAAIQVRIRDLIWDRVYTPIASLIGTGATKLNGLQFLTIRQYLSLVFATLVILLLGLAAWS